MPFAGHVGPMSAVAAELVRRGHEVVAYTGAKYRDRFIKAGASWLPWIKATDFDDADLAATFPAVGDGKGFRGTKANGDHVVFGTASGQIADIMAGAPYDLLVTDQVALGGAVAGQGLGIPWATVAVTPLSLTSRYLPPVGMPWAPATGPAGRLRDALLRGMTGALYRRMTDPRINALRAGVSLGPVEPGRLFDGLYSTDLVIAQGVPGLEYLRPDLPDYVHFVGRLAPTPPADRRQVEATQAAGPTGATGVAVGPVGAGGVAPGPVGATGAVVDPPGTAAEPTGTAVVTTAESTGHTADPTRPPADLTGPATEPSGSIESATRPTGSTGAAASADLPSWWPDLAAARAVVHVTQGTLDVDPADLIRPTLAGLADRDLLVVCTTGGADPATLGPLPANARAAAFFPHDLLLPATDVMVTNGGWGGVLAAVQAGVPLVVAGASLDKPEVARRVAWSGVGVDLRTGRPDPAAVARAVDRVLAEPAFRTRAGELGAALTAAGGAAAAADLIERLLTR